MKAVTKAVHARYPGLSIVPSMSAGATDSMHFRALGVPSYGVSGLFMKDSDEFAMASTSARRSRDRWRAGALGCSVEGAGALSASRGVRRVDLLGRVADHFRRVRPHHACDFDAVFHEDQRRPQLHLE